MAFELEKAPKLGAFFWLEKPTCLGAKPPNRTTESKIRCSEYTFKNFVILIFLKLVDEYIFDIAFII